MVTLDPLAVRVARRFLGAAVFRSVPAERVNVASMDSGRLMSWAEVTVDDQGRGVGAAEDPTAGRVAVQCRRDTGGLVPVDDESEGGNDAEQAEDDVAF